MEVPELRILSEELVPVKEKWKELGKLLGLTEKQLQQCTHPEWFTDPGDLLCCVLDFWLRGNTSVSPTWENVIYVLESVKEIELSEKLKEKYCPDWSPHSVHSIMWSEEQSPPTSADGRLTESDIPQLMEKLAPHAAKWWDIGIALKFTPSELGLIAAKPRLFHGAPNTYLVEMLYQWVQWSPETEHGKYATLPDLKQALRSRIIGLGALAETI